MDKPFPWIFFGTGDPNFQQSADSRKFWSPDRMAAATSQLSMWLMIMTLLVEYSSARKDRQAMRSQFTVSVRTECFHIPEAPSYLNTQRRVVWCHVFVYVYVFMFTESSLFFKFFLKLGQPIGGFTALLEILFLRLQLGHIPIWIGNILFWTSKYDMYVHMFTIIPAEKC